MQLITRKIELRKVERKRIAIRKQVEILAKNLNEPLEPHIKGFVCQMMKKKARLNNGRFC